MHDWIILRMDADPRDGDRVLVAVGPEGRPEQQILNLHIAVVSQEMLRTALPCPPELIARLRKADEFQRHYVRALNFLAVRPRSESEVRERLRNKGVPPEDIDPVIMRLHRAGYLDDAEFARMWVRERTRFNPRGPRLLRQELYRKGIARQLIDEVLAGVELPEQEPSSGPPAPADWMQAEPPGEADEADPQLEQALALARRKLSTYGRLDDQTFRRRMTGFLLRRGYGYEVVAKVLKRLRATADVDEEADGYEL